MSNMNNHEHHQNNNKSNLQFSDFLPLIVIFSLIIILTIILQIYSRSNLKEALNNFMGLFFLIFGTFKIINLSGFVEAYRTYDLIAQRNLIYAYLYPFIELCLGIFYLAQIYLKFTNVVTLILMSLGSVSVFIELGKRREITCACLGAVFKIPMTWVTLLEDLSMATMALIMLIINY